MDETAVRQGICTVLAANIDDLRCEPYQLNAINPPVFVVHTLQITYDLAFGRGLDQIMATCRMYTSASSDRAGQLALGPYLAGSGGSSIKAALLNDRTLNGSCSDHRVESTGPFPTIFTIGTDNYYGADINIRIYGEG
jgi:hypothetical protein